MWKVIIKDEDNNMALLESFGSDTERDTNRIIADYFTRSDLNIDGVRHIRIEKICVDNEKLYKEALELIAQQQKVVSCGYGSQDNTYEVETARTALGLPLDIPEYDNPEYKYMEE